MVEAKLWERRDLQALLIGSADVFFDEIGEPLLILGEEVRPSAVVPDRIDLLALDESGAPVIIELKRGSHKLQLLQALTYAGMIFRWPEARFAETLADHRHITAEAARDQIEEFLTDSAGALNRRQRIILIAEGFDAAVLATAEWLVEQHSLDILCFTLEVLKDGTAEYLNVVRVYPPQRSTAMDRDAGRPEDWETALQAIANPSLVKFVEEQLRRPERRGTPSKGTIRIRRNQERLFWMALRPEFVRVGQFGRFDGDLDFWRQRLDAKAKIVETRNGAEVRFRLRTEADFAAFSRALDHELVGVAFRKPLDAGDEDDEEADMDPETPTS
jgi:hypothetical protein